MVLYQIWFPILQLTMSGMCDTTEDMFSIIYVKEILPLLTALTRGNTRVGEGSEGLRLPAPWSITRTDVITFLLLKSHNTT